tara:strand:- start:183 stop:938 length:756 start_codon:yes stop_codon:yes gene_type:complete
MEEKLSNKRIKIVEFLGIKFKDLDIKDFSYLMKQSGLFVFPSGPGISNLKTGSSYHKALLSADYVFFDSGYFVLLLKILKNIKVKKFSGYKFLKYLFIHLEKNKYENIFLIDPNEEISQNNCKYLNRLSINNLTNYVAPHYNDVERLSDQDVLEKIIKVRPNLIIINIGGGTQEVLGDYIKKNINFETKIICTGAAISFFTKDQAPINSIFDKLYLGWLIRILFKPQIFLKRYFKSLRLAIIVYKEKIREY